MTRNNSRHATARHARRLMVEHLERRDVPSFVAAPIFPLVSDGAGDPEAMAVENLNDDGIPDIMVVKKFDGAVDVLLSLGNGQFGSATAYAVPLCNKWIAETLTAMESWTSSCQIRPAS